MIKKLEENMPLLYTPGTYPLPFYVLDLIVLIIFFIYFIILCCYFILFCFILLLSYLNIIVAEEGLQEKSFVIDIDV